MLRIDNSLSDLGFLFGTASKFVPYSLQSDSPLFKAKDMFFGSGDYAENAGKGFNYILKYLYSFEAPRIKEDLKKYA